MNSQWTQNGFGFDRFETHKLATFRKHLIINKVD